MVYYRKYRPQKIADLDNLDVQQKLYSVLASNTPHAFLFTGPKGLGKTSTARIIAKTVNCEKAGNGWQVAGSNKNDKKATSHEPRATSQVEPCNICDQCISITNGANLDVLEIDAASNRGIDEIRDLKEKIRLSPVSCPKKVYIIDEVHMLTTEAFNALLKTLEEPPSHAMFILCTTELQKVPATIASRCFHINFKPATEEELVRSFTRIVKAEDISIDEDALKYIAGLSDRGFRDGVKILEEVVSLAGGKKITLPFVEEKYQISNAVQYVSQMLDALAGRDAKKGLEIIGVLVDQGFDIKYFLTQLMGSLHEMLITQVKVNNSPHVAEAMMGKQLTLLEIRKLFELLSKAYADMRYTVLPQLPLELAVIEYADMSQIKTLIDAGTDHQPAIKIVENSSLDQHKSASGSASISDLRKQVGVIQKNKALYGEPKVVAEVKPEMEISKVELMKALANGEVTKEWQDVFWRSLISEMKQYNHTIVGVLRGCNIRSYGHKQLIIETPFKFHKERLDEVLTRETLAKVCKTLTGNEVQIEVELKNS